MHTLFHSMAPASPTGGLSVVVPLHNEAGFLPIGLPRLLEIVVGLADEVWLVENGSTDATLSLARQAAAIHPLLRVLALPTPDYGAALREGFLAARGEWVVAFDIDYASRRFLEQMDAEKERADIVLASKRDPASSDSRSRLRRIGTVGFNLALRTLFGSRVSDTHGIKAIRREVITRLAPQVLSTRDLFDTELVLRAERAGYSIIEVPTQVLELRAARSSFVKRIPRTVRQLLRLRRQLGRRP